MELTPLHVERANVSMTTLANANELAVAIIGRIVGNDISTMIGESKATRAVMQGMLQSVYRKKFSETVRI